MGISPCFSKKATSSWSQGIIYSRKSLKDVKIMTFNTPFPGDKILKMRIYKGKLIYVISTTHPYQYDVLNITEKDTSPLSEDETNNNTFDNIFEGFRERGDFT